MKARPIIFTGAMVRAILDGIKTQTRRVLDPQPFHDSDDSVLVWKEGRVLSNDRLLRHCPYGAPGDLLWVRERWREDSPDDADRALYAATPPRELPPGFKWKSPIHMPRWASRITLRLSDVRLERLQSISAESCIAEGLRVPRCGCEVCSMSGRICPADASTYVLAYRELWESINGPGSWEANPWVWVLGFSRNH